MLVERDVTLMQTQGPLDYQQALLDPSSVFETPEAVLQVDTLSTDQKIEVLRRWVYDARELSVAEEEGMRTDRPSLLRRVLIALAELGVHIDVEHTSPTKQNGA
jgi:hypothetical protein